MARKSGAAVRAKASGNLGEEIQATRVIWNDGIQSMSGSWSALTSDLREFSAELFDSPLGKRARRNPGVSVTVASIAAMTILRLLRR